MNLLNYIVLGTVLLGLNSFAASPSAPMVPAESTLTDAATIEVYVRDENGVLANAQVWVENQNGKLLDKGTTSSDGVFKSSVGLDQLSQGLGVTAAASGHASVSLMQIQGNKIEFSLPLQLTDKYAILSGTLRGFEESDDETEGMAGMVSRAFVAADLATLEVSSLISPMKDTIDVLGPRQVPSNLVIPDQTFPVFFVPVRVSKPTYRFPTLTGSSNRYFGISGLVDVQATINALRQNQPWDIINLLKFKKFAVTGTINAPKNPGEVLKLDVNTDKSIKQFIKLQPGRVDSGVEGDASKRRVALSLFEAEPEVYVPTDVKLVQNGFKGLSAVSTSSKVIEVLATEDGNRFRSEWHKASQGKLPDVALQANVDFRGLDNAIELTASPDSKLSVLHFEEYKQTSVGSKTFQDRWIVVTPKVGALQLPVQALADLRGKLGSVSHVSVDMMEYGNVGYVKTQSTTVSDSGSKIQVIEKVRKSANKR